MTSTILVSILALVFVVLISPNFLDKSQGQRTGDLPLDKSIADSIIESLKIDPQTFG